MRIFCQDNTLKYVRSKLFYGNVNYRGRKFATKIMSYFDETTVKALYTLIWKSLDFSFPNAARVLVLSFCSLKCQ